MSFETEIPQSSLTPFLKSFTKAAKIIILQQPVNLDRPPKIDDFTKK